MKIIKSRRKNNQQRLLVASIVVVFLLFAVAAIFIRYTSNNIASPTSSPQDSPKDGGSNPSSQNNPIPQSNTKSNDITPATSLGENVNVVVVDASQYSDVVEVRVYAQAVADGKCTFEFSNGSKGTLSKQAVAKAGANTTQCTTIDVPVTDFPTKGSWQLSVTYTSDDGKLEGSATSSFKVD